MMQVERKTENRDGLTRVKFKITVHARTAAEEEEQVSTLRNLLVDLSQICSKLSKNGTNEYRVLKTTAPDQKSDDKKKDKQKKGNKHRMTTRIMAVFDTTIPGYITGTEEAELYGMYRKHTASLPQKAED